MWTCPNVPVIGKLSVHVGLNLDTSLMSEYNQELLCMLDISTFAIIQYFIIEYNCIAGKFDRGKVWYFYFFKHLMRKVWQMNKSAERLLIVSSSLV